MLALIMALCLSFAGSGQDDVIAYVYFDGDIYFMSLTPSDYAIVEVFSCDGGSHDLIWTSEHISSGGSYLSDCLYTTAKQAGLNSPFEVVCSYYTPRIENPFNTTVVSGLEWGLNGDFVEIPPGSHNWYCTNDF